MNLKSAQFYAFNVVFRSPLRSKVVLLARILRFSSLVKVLESFIGGVLISFILYLVQRQSSADRFGWEECLQALHAMVQPAKNPSTVANPRREKMNRPHSQVISLLPMNATNSCTEKKLVVKKVHHLNPE
jgi:hypothetical protein